MMARAVKVAVLLAGCRREPGEEGSWEDSGERPAGKVEVHG